MNRVMAIARVAVTLAACAAGAPGSAQGRTEGAGGRAGDLPGKVVTSWIGNSFEGAGGNGRGRWVQNFIDEIEVTPDGAVMTCSGWDEAGRCTGIYKDGDVNSDLLKQYGGKGGHKAWGWGTASAAVAVEGRHIFLANTDGDLMRFKWDPSNIHVYEYIDQVRAGKAAGMTARDGKLYVVGEKGEIQVRGTSDLKEASRFTVGGAKDIAVDERDRLWVLAGEEIASYAADGTRLRWTVADAGHPVAVSVDNQGRLVVCDDGPRQQVLFYDIARRPRLVRAFGKKGGIGAGTRGRATPLKLFALKGAGTDAEGNIYVALSKRESVVRKFTPEGRLVWELQSQPFTDCYEVYAPSDGREVYGVEEIFELDLGKGPGREWKLRSITRDQVRYPDDPRVKGGAEGAAFIRKLEGRRILYVSNMYSSNSAKKKGFDIFSFEDPPSDIARHAGVVSGEGWAWDVDSRGDIWEGEAKGRKIRRHRFERLDDRGFPVYAKEPDEFAWPAPFSRVQRVRHVSAEDVLYVSGYTPEKGEKAWGLIGSVLARYDGWSKGNRKAEYLVDMPTDDDGLHPKALDVAGDYIFVVAVKPTRGRPAMVHVYRAADGTKAGAMSPGPEVGGKSGWVDICYGIRAFRRSNGEYLVIVEEDWRAKNILYRWSP